MESIFHVLLSAAVFLLAPLGLAYERFFPVSRAVILLAVLGVYALMAPLTPGPFALWSNWFVAMVAVFCVRHYREGHREPFSNPLRLWPVPLILTIGFALFLWRWDPPGIESALVGAAARKVAVAQHFSQGSDGGAVSLLVAMGNLGHWAPIERLVGFFTAVAAVLFIFTLASALGLWFERKVALIAALFAMVIFAAPQALLASGAAPVLFGLTSGWCLLEFAKVVLIRTGTWWEWVLYAVATAFGAYCDAGAFIVSMAVCFPAVLWAYRVCDSRRRFLRNMGIVLGLTSILVLPALWNVRFLDPPMNPSGAWPLAAVAALILGVVSLFVNRRVRHALPTVLCLSVAGGILVLSYCGRLPVSFFRAAEAMAVFPLAMPVAWLVDRFTGEWRKPMRFAHGAVFGIFLAIAVHQFRANLLAEFETPQLSSRDRAAMRYVESFLPADDCVQIDPRFAGRWIPTLSHRCVVTSSDKAKWLFLADGEPRPAPTEDDPVFEGGAMIYPSR